LFSFHHKFHYSSSKAVFDSFSDDVHRQNYLFPDPGEFAPATDILAAARHFELRPDRITLNKVGQYPVHIPCNKGSNSKPAASSILAGPSEIAPQMMTMTFWGQQQSHQLHNRSGSKVRYKVLPMALLSISAISSVRAESNTGETRSPQTEVVWVCEIARDVK
jgi:hypothetical protein